MKIKGLTEAQTRVAELVGKGMEDREIATELNVKVRTVHFHVTEILAKTGLGNRTKLALAVHGIIKVPSRTTTS